MMMLTRMIAPLIRYHRTIGIVLACYWGALFVGTHVPVPRIVDLPEHSDKGMHFLAYAGLSFILMLWLSTARKITIRHYLIIFGITMLYAVADELLQIPLDRTCDLYDAVVDCIGSTIGLLSAAVVRRILLRYWEPAEFPSPG